MIDFAAVNWLAVLVAAVVSFVIGGLWYSVLFAKPWSRYTGITGDSEQSSGRMALYFGGAFATYLIAMAVLGVVMQAAGAASIGAGLALGLLIGAGIVAPVSYNIYMFSGRPLGLFLIDLGYPVVALAVSGAILGAWQ